MPRTNDPGPGITLTIDSNGRALAAETRQASKSARPVTRRVFANVFDTFEDDWPGVADGIERVPPFGPVDCSVSGGQMRILAAVIVVDVGRRQERARCFCFGHNTFAQIGVAGIESQREVKVIELGQQLGQVGHPAAGMHARRHVLDADQYAGALGMASKPNESLSQGRARRGCSASSDRPPG